MSDLTGRSINGKIRLHNGLVFLSETTDDRPCKCCAFECAAEVTVEVTFCGHTQDLQVTIPGSSFINVDLDGEGPSESYINLSASISCSACGWYLEIGVCAFCEATNTYASDSFFAFIPFADTAEATGGYCPEPGVVDLTCFGDQFGIPCITTATAEIA